MRMFGKVKTGEGILGELTENRLYPLYYSDIGDDYYRVPADDDKEHSYFKHRFKIISQLHYEPY